MTITKIPPSAGRFNGSQNDLLDWLESNRRLLGDVYHAHAYGTNVYVVSDPRHVDHVLRRNWQNYKKGLAIKRVALLLGGGLMVSEGEFWKRQRRMVQPAFHSRVITGLTETITQANIALLRRWEQAAEHGQNVNITRDISLMILEIVLRAIFGSDYQQVAPPFRILSDESERNLRFAQAFRSLGGLVSQIAAHRRENNDNSPDILGILMNASDKDSGQSMSDGQLVDEVLTLIVAGHETTASTLNWTWYLLSRNPEAERKLNAEASSDFGGVTGLTYTSQVVEEVLRLYPAGWLMTRCALHDDTLGDYFVPAGTEIYISPYMIQRHPDIWKDPDRFDPGRFALGQSTTRHPSTMLPFSQGPRNCIGEHLARLEMLIHLRTIASKLRLRYLGSEPLDVDLGVNLRSKHDFIMLPTLLT